jgi:hypothetical protein
MSAARTFKFQEANFVTSDDGHTAAPGLSAPNLLALGWIPASRIATYNTAILQVAFRSTR